MLCTFITCWRHANNQAVPLHMSIVMLHNFLFVCLCNLSIDTILKLLSIDKLHKNILFVLYTLSIDRSMVMWYTCIKIKGGILMKKITLQYTLFCTTGQYKPVSCLIDIDDINYFNTHQKEYKQKAIEKICIKRYWTGADLKRYGYTQIKCRRYEKGLDK